MDISKIVAEIDAKITSLQQARAVLVDLDEGVVESKPRRGRPKGSANAVSVLTVKGTKTTRRKRNLSPEGRKRIAEAMKRRWAEHRSSNQKAKKKDNGKKETAPKKETVLKK